MILFPAIDLKDGACVRLVRGEMDHATVFNTDPASQARSFTQAGCEWIHVVDLNGAFAGKPVNAEAVKGIIKAAGVPVQLGGGIRDRATIESWLEAGVSRVILGTVALRDPALVRQACKAYPGQVAVGIDAKGGKVAVEGWAETSELTPKELALKFEDAGAAAIIYTDIDRDGLMGGPNVSATAALAEALTTPVIASGGVSCLKDLLALKAVAYTGILGAISGRAIYDGRLDVAQAVRALKETP
ncbi:MAG: 1-(5-phosphoribosyl)-5-[(5-phosphoribosylamino)methylideneamino]imidazole-4-carboxamide isomerase [Alphaproteobacteria bacterium RIFOXYD12_FULL_60_8]|nr:MAG: 1-(5-phosphoribosyl)-5-[(5-phosphoribosylamino)methylideneamino]imidazole-4-carboxamide isomerase [Alphaproteobacteria bacterium RIFOXYD12_FULL_60_8]